MNREVSMADNRQTHARGDAYMATRHGMAMRAISFRDFTGYVVMNVSASVDCVYSIDRHLNMSCRYSCCFVVVVVCRVDRVVNCWR